MSQNGFVHLHLHSAYSLAEGAIKIPDLIGLCQEQGMPAVAVTDSNNLFGALEFALAASKSGVQPIIGSQVELGLEGHEIVLLVTDEKGYRNICKLVSDAYLTGDSSHKVHIEWSELEAHHEGLICLTGGVKGVISQYLLHNQPKEAEAALKKLKKIFGDRLYIELQRHEWPEEERIENALIELAYKHEVPLVATNDCYFAKRKMYEAHDALLCIAEGKYVIQDDRRKVTPEHYFKTAKEMQELFSDIPEAIDNTLVVAQRCHFLLKSIDPLLPPFVTEDGLSEKEEIRAQAGGGLEWRLENFVFTDDMDDAAKEETAKPYRERLKYELDVIEEMGFPGYFLIVSDFIKWAKERNIPVGPGRGSGAGSVVAWAMKITDLDPLRFQLLFERFLNPERVSMPDFDIDFCQERRDEVIKYVQDRYGYNHVAQIITFGKLQARAVVRDVGRVLQMPYGQVDRIAKMIPANPANPVSLEEALVQESDLREERRKDETTDKLITIALQLEGLFRHASTHAAGVVIGDRELHELVPLYRDPRSDMPVTQFNMKYVEQAGLVKFDFLGLKNMTVIQKAVEYIKATKGEDIDILQIPFEDEKTYAMLARGENTGVFQMESAGMRDLGKQMKISNFEHIIAVVALYRPGPMENIPLYLSNMRGDTEIDYMHPKLKPFLEDTYGVMIYQEQVMQAAQVLAGYTLGGADLLRRAMGKKIQAEMDAQRELFVKGAKEHNDVPEEQANHIFDQIAKFAGYGFNKAHSAGYALIAYWTAWLKANYPVEFMAASMTLDMGNTEKLAVFKQELDRMGIELRPPDINHSLPTFKVEGEAIRYALAALKGVGDAAMTKLVAERTENGPFTSLVNMAERLESGVMNKKQLEQLACAGAFDTFIPNRARVYGAAETLLKYASALQEEKAAGQTSLFGGEGGVQTAELEIPDVEEWDPLDKLKHEFDAVGFYLSAHPLDSKAQQLERVGVVACGNILETLKEQNAAIISMAGVLIRKQIRISQKTGNKFAFLQLSDSTGVYEVMVFSETLQRAHDYLNVGETLLLKVMAEQQEDDVRYTVQDIRQLDTELSGKVKEIHIFMDKTDSIEKLKTLLGAEGEGNTKIRVFIDVDTENRAEILLPGAWTFSQQAQNAIGKSEGVTDIQVL